MGQRAWRGRHRFFRALRSFRGQHFAAKGQHPPFAAAFAVPRRHRRPRSPCPRCPSGKSCSPPCSAFARSMGLGATPLHPRDGRPGNGRLLPPLLPLSGSLPARASGASDPCGKAAPGRWRHPRSGPRRVPRGAGPRASSSPHRALPHAPLRRVPRADVPILDFNAPQHPLFPGFAGSSVPPRARIGIVSRITTRGLPLGVRSIPARPNAYPCSCRYPLRLGAAGRLRMCCLRCCRLSGIAYNTVQYQ